MWVCVFPAVEWRRPSGVGVVVHPSDPAFAWAAGLVPPWPFPGRRLTLVFPAGVSRGEYVRRHAGRRCRPLALYGRPLLHAVTPRVWGWSVCHLDRPWEVRRPGP